MGMDQPKLTVEQSFRESLKDVVAVVQKLAPHCNGFDDLIGMVELAINNDGQLHLLMNTVIASTGKR